MTSSHFENSKDRVASMLDDTNLNSFLKFGCFLDYKDQKYSIDTSGIDKVRYRDCNERELIERGAMFLKKSVEDIFSCGQKHLVPISGGLDSRAILAVLLEFTEARNIHTFTRGTPKTWDYEIGNLVAKSIGTNHTSFDLTTNKYTMDELIDISNRINHQTVLFHHAPLWKIDKLFKGCKYWSGFLGETLAGSHLPNSPANTLDEAKKYFIRKNTYVQSIDLTNCTEHAFCDLIDDENCIDKRLLTLEEQLDFKNRQIKFIAPHVLMSGYEYRLPFLDRDWINFVLSADNKYRKNEYLYIKLLSETYPELFSLITKNTLGLPLFTNKARIFIRRAIRKSKRILNRYKHVFLDRGINYMDFNNAIRNKKDLKNIIYENIMDLKNHKLVDWIDINTIWKKHISGQVNYADALLVLASLEIHLKSKNQ